jgi:hypothetical protein
VAVASEAHDDSVLDPGESQGEQHRGQRQTARGRLRSYADPHEEGVSSVPEGNSSTPQPQVGAVAAIREDEVGRESLSAACGGRRRVV